MNIPNEGWKDIPNRPGYQAHQNGSIRSLHRSVLITGRGLRKLRGKVLKPRVRIDGSGYGCVTLCCEGERIPTDIHRVIAITFIPNPENKPEVNHKNGNKRDNRAENLEWMTHQQNILHASRVLKKMRVGESNFQSRLKPDEVLEIMALKFYGARCLTVAKAYGIAECAIRKIWTGKTWRHLFNAPTPAVSPAPASAFPI